jgi:hypothetical protein
MNSAILDPLDRPQEPGECAGHTVEEDRCAYPVFSLVDFEVSFRPRDDAVPILRDADSAYFETDSVNDGGEQKRVKDVQTCVRSACAGCDEGQEELYLRNSRYERPAVAARQKSSQATTAAFCDAKALLTAKVRRFFGDQSGS